MYCSSCVVFAWLIDGRFKCRQWCAVFVVVETIDIIYWCVWWKRRNIGPTYFGRWCASCVIRHSDILIFCWVRPYRSSCWPRDVVLGDIVFCSETSCPESHFWWMSRSTYFVDSRQKEFPALYLCGSAIDVQLDRRIAVAMTGLLWSIRCNRKTFGPYNFHFVYVLQCLGTYLLSSFRVNLDGEYHQIVLLQKLMDYLRKNSYLLVLVFWDGGCCFPLDIETLWTIDLFG